MLKVRFWWTCTSIYTYNNKTLYNSNLSVLFWNLTIIPIFIFCFVLDSIQTISNNETTNQSQQPGEIVNNRDVHVNIPVPSAPPDAYLYYIPPSNEDYHPRYPPRDSINTPQPASTNRRQNPASTQNSGTDTQSDDDTCIVCFDHRVEILLRPCYHFNLCEGCSLLVTQCPTCRGIIQEKIKPYR